MADTIVIIRPRSRGEHYTVVRVNDADKITFWGSYVTEKEAAGKANQLAGQSGVKWEWMK